MSASVPLKVTNGVIDEVNSFLLTAGRYLARSDALYLRWLEELSSVPDDLADERAIALAVVSQVSGDIHLFEDCIAQARRNDAKRQTILETQLVGYGNLTYATKAQGAFRQGVDVSAGNLGMFAFAGLAVGSFHRTQELIEQARRAGVALDEVAAIRGFDAAARILKARAFSDEECADVIDVAGEVLRSRSLFWLGPTPQVLPDEGQATVLLRYRISISPSEAAAANGELISKLVDKGLDQAPLMVAFVGVSN